MDTIETRFLKAQKFHPLVWFRYINDVFFIWTHGKEELENFMKELKCTFEPNKENINFLDVNINLSNGHLMTNMYIKHRLSAVFELFIISSQPFQTFYSL